MIGKNSRQIPKLRRGRYGVYSAESAIFAIAKVVEHHHRIASSGLKILIEAQTNFDNKKNLLIASVILVSGIGGLTLQLSGLQISGVALSTVLGIALYLILPEPKN